MQRKLLHLKKNEDRRIRTGHVWIYSNEIDTQKSPLKSFSPGEEVTVIAHDQTALGTAYINPHSLISGRLITRNANESLNLELLQTRMQTALAFRDQLYKEPYYRLIFGESDQLPGLVVDRFDDVLSVQINTAGMDCKTDLIIQALSQILPSVKSILLRNDSPARLQEGLECYIKEALGTPPEKVKIIENGTVFYAPLWQGQKTGWFYDHRLNRSRLKDYVTNKRVLDVFSYLGAWGIEAAKWGAAEVVCVDSSSLSKAAIDENAALNQVSDKTRVITDDAFIALKNLYQARERFDVIILDPPAFVKKAKDKKEGILAYQRINEAALRLLAPNGILISCSCSMHMTYDELVNALRRASYRSEVELQMIERGHQAPDHPVHLAIPETDYLKMIVVKRMN